MSTSNLAPGYWTPTQMQRLQYGKDAVKEHLLSCMPRSSSKAFIVTGSSLATKTTLIRDVEELLGNHHAKTFSSIGAHAPIKDIDAATDLIATDFQIDTIISIGGGSPIDAAKAISNRLVSQSQRSTHLHHITIPTTISAAEVTMISGFTSPTGAKTSIIDPNLVPHVIIYDPVFASQTPPRLFASTGIRALDHATEMLYHPQASEVPAKAMALSAVQALFKWLPVYHKDPTDLDAITRLQLAAFASLYSFGTSMTGGLGLSHSLGYAIGSPYGVPHGITSCITLPGVVRLKARGDEWCAAQLARALPYTGIISSGDARKDALRYADAVESLIDDLGLSTRLGDYGIGDDKIDTIVKTATKTEEGDLFEKVRQLVRDKL